MEALVYLGFLLVSTLIVLAGVAVCGLYLMTRDKRKSLTRR